MLWLSSLFLVTGAAICLIAAAGVLRLPDFFMRMHAATEAGVAGCGLVLIGVGFAYPSLDVWVKVAIGVGFLLVTTPIAGHLLARAGYVAGVPLWSGTSSDELAGTLKRGSFDGPFAQRMPRPAGADAASARFRVVVALSAGPGGEAVAAQAIALAKASDAELLALAIIDAKQIAKVGPVPVGGNHYAARLRASRLEEARRRLAASVERFEAAASHAGLSYALQLEEGDPAALLGAHLPQRGLLLIDGQGWFDHGAGDGVGDPLGHLVARGVFPLAAVASSPEAIERIVFLHDGSPHSERRLAWFLANDPWPEAELVLHCEEGAHEVEVARASALTTQRGRGSVPAADKTQELLAAHVIVHGNQGHPGWINQARRAGGIARSAPIVIFG